MEKKIWEIDKEFIQICDIISQNFNSSLELLRGVDYGFQKWYEELKRIDEEILNLNMKCENKSKADYYTKKDILKKARKNHLRKSKKLCFVMKNIDSSIDDAKKLFAEIIVNFFTSADKFILQDFLEETDLGNNRYIVESIIDTKIIPINNLLGNTLRNDFDYIIGLSKTYSCTEQELAFCRAIGDELKYKEKFLLEFLRCVVKKYQAEKSLDDIDDRISYIMRIIYPGGITENPFLVNNESFYEEIKKLGLKKVMHNSIYSMTTKTDYIASHLDEITKWQSDNIVLMLKVIELNPNAYLYASDRLKKKDEFNKEALKLGVSKQMIEEENKKISLNHSEKYDNKSKKHHEKVSTIYGKGTLNYNLVYDYLESADSSIKYCNNNNIDEEEFHKIFENVIKCNPELEEMRKNKADIIHNEWIRKTRNHITEILNNEEYIYEFASKRTSKTRAIDLVRVAEEKKYIIEVILKAILSGKLKMYNYMILFSEEFEYSKTITSINEFFNYIEVICPELQGNGKLINLAKTEVKKLRRYEAKYSPRDFVDTKRGFIDEYNEAKIVEISEERLNEIIKYLKDNNEYICYSTVNEAINKFVKECWAI